MSSAAMSVFGTALLEVVRAHVSSSAHLRHASDWNQVQRSLSSAADLQVG